MRNTILFCHSAKISLAQEHIPYFLGGFAFVGLPPPFAHFEHAFRVIFSHKVSFWEHPCNSSGLLWINHPFQSPWNVCIQTSPQGLGPVKYSPMKMNTPLEASLCGLSAEQLQKQGQ